MRFRSLVLTFLTMTASTTFASDSTRVAPKTLRSETFSFVEEQANPAPSCGPENCSCSDDVGGCVASCGKKEEAGCIGGGAVRCTCSCYSCQ